MRTDLSKLNRIIFVIISIAGIILSFELILVYYNANFNPDAAPSFCAVNEYLDCDGVAESIFSRFLGIPLAVWGLGFYSFIFLLALFPFHKLELFRDFKHPRSYIFTMSSFAVIVSIILFFISHFVMEKVCILCQNLYIINAVLFIAAKPGNTFVELYKNTINDVKNILSDEIWRNIAVLVVITGVIALVLVNIYKPFSPENPAKQIKPETYYKIGTIGNVLGSEDAKLVIHEYTDYECPFCEISNAMMLRLSKEVEGIRIEHHDFPLDKTCNPSVKNSIHKNSCLAIYYAKAAKKQGKFWDMAFLLFQNREDLSEKNILKLAESIDLDTEKLKKDVQENKELYNKQIREDVANADDLGINGTPSYVIGIKKYEGILPYSQLKEKVLESL